MVFKATRNLSGARQMVKATNMELESLTGYSSPSFGRVGSSGKGGRPTDRVSGMYFRKEKLEKHLTDILDYCLHLEEASQAELDSVDNLELRSMILYREVYQMTWAQIGREMNMSADAAKKRYERGLKAYEEQAVVVQYPQSALRAIRWLDGAVKTAGIKDRSELKKTSVDLFNEKEAREKAEKEAAEKAVKQDSPEPNEAELQEAG